MADSVVYKVVYNFKRNTRYPRGNKFLRKSRFPTNFVAPGFVDFRELRAHSNLPCGMYVVTQRKQTIWGDFSRYIVSLGPVAK